MSTSTTKQSGFTLVEITLAMAIFTFMLLVVSLAYINIARLYSASTSARNVQQNNRFAMEQITRVARVSSRLTTSDINAQGSVGRLCFTATARATQIFYVQNDELRQASVASCDAPNPTVYKTLTSGGAQVGRIEASTVANTATVRIWLVSKLDLLATREGSTLQCTSGPRAEFCAINKLTTTVELRGE